MKGHLPTEIVQTQWIRCVTQNAQDLVHPKYQCAAELLCREHVTLQVISMFKTVHVQTDSQTKNATGVNATSMPTVLTMHLPSMLIST